MLKNENERIFEKNSAVNSPAVSLTPLFLIEALSFNNFYYLQSKERGIKYASVVLQEIVTKMQQVMHLISIRNCHLGNCTCPVKREISCL